MKKHMLRVLSMAIALTMSMTFALSGCGSDTGSSTSGEGTTSSTEESTGTEEGASTEETGDTETAQTTDYSDVVINYGLTTAWDSLNPPAAPPSSTWSWISCMTAWPTSPRQRNRSSQEPPSPGNPPRTA